MLISDPSAIGSLWKLILWKAVIAIAAGVLVDLLARAFKLSHEEQPFKELCSDCDCEHHSIDLTFITYLLYTYIEMATVILTEGNPLAKRNVEDFPLETIGNLRNAEAVIAWSIGAEHHIGSSFCGMLTAGYQ